jgi:hypothetical protein
LRDGYACLKWKEDKETAEKERTAQGTVSPVSVGKDQGVQRQTNE